MRRLVAFGLIQAMVVSAAAASSLHVHEYAGHNHPEHHHGPASHEHGHQHHAPPDPDHHVEGVHEDHPEMEGEPCDPGRHAVAVTLGCTDITQVHIEIAELAGPTVIAPTALVRSAGPITDVRAHGPPFDRTPSRAPPLVSPA